MRVRFRLVVALSIVSSVGCASIAGLNDLKTVDCADETCGTGEEAGSAGGPVGGSGGGGGKSGQGGSSGKGGAGGVAGKAGAGGLGGGSAGSGGNPAGGLGGAGNGGTAGGPLAGTGGGGSPVGGTGGVAGTGGKAGTGGCIPKTCKTANAECGDLSDGCSGTLKCSACGDTRLNCGVTTASGVIPNVCGCAPSTYRCDGAMLSQCTPDGQGYVLAANCGTAAQCSPGKPPTGGGGTGGSSGGGTGGGSGGAPSPGVPGTCTACAAGTTLCQGLQIFTCATGTFSKKTPTPCPSTSSTPGACDPSNGGSCKACVPNAFSCNGSKLAQCDAVGGALADKTTCASAALCEKSVFAGECVPPACEVGEHRCVGAKSRVCGPNRDGFVDDQLCASDALCVNGLCKAPACGPADTKCDGNVLQKCTADRSGFEKSVDCTTPKPACGVDAGKAACIVRGPALVQQAQAFGYVHATEVTVGQYKVFLAENSSLPKQSPECAGNIDLGTPGGGADNLPRVNVDWCDAQSYCKWAGMQLCGVIGMPGAHLPPANAADEKLDQWAAFCKGPSKTAYPYGSVYDENACNGPNAASPPSGPVVVASKTGCSVSNLIFDMTGNVSEWVDSCVGYTAMTETCLTRGGSYQTKGSTGVSCNGAEVNIPRSAQQPDIGFRCCVQ